VSPSVGAARANERKKTRNAMVGVSFILLDFTAVLARYLVRD